ncbi:hypothetical protein SPI_04286 [Niveomyces insectorum RCEF 264]|uniref:Nucleotidyl transferase AbiEii/AbiGii toxin family protein n=1 Tax=Niveomyces insectorum RCEF 264 TaxID=1081102 RepID=A0A167VL64_9HYPO|nr:hypothetical protein SPI_04286 [Niveomyces insectorum RCEF 264]
MGCGQSTARHGGDVELQERPRVARQRGNARGNVPVAAAGPSRAHFPGAPAAPHHAAARSAKPREHGRAAAAQHATAGPSRSAPPVISHEVMSSQTVGDAVRMISHSLNSSEYVLIGGIALQLLGSRRATADIDVLVPTGHAGRVAVTLGSTRDFGTDRQQSGRSRVWYNARNRKHYNVDIMEPGDIQQVFPSHGGAVIVQGSSRILAPELLLNYKCYSWSMRDKPQKKLNDSQDILFLLQYMISHGIHTSRRVVVHASDDFFFYEFLASYPHAQQLFREVGL